MRPGLCGILADVDGRDALIADRRRNSRAANLARALAVMVHRVTLARRNAPFHDDPGDAGIVVAGGLRLECGFPGELGLIELDGPALTGRERRDLFAHLVPVQRHARLEAQDVAGGEPARLEAVALAGGEQCIPNVWRVSALDEQLEAILACIAGAGDDRLDTGH